MEAAGQRSSMSNLQQAAHRAVEVMNAHMMRADTDEFYEAKEALRKALVDADDTSQERVDEKAKREQEPVAWITDGGKGELWWYQSSKFDEEGNLIGPNPDDIPLYTAPPKQWVRLTDDEIYDCEEEAGVPQYEISSADLYAFAQAIEAKLREKNA